MHKRRIRLRIPRVLNEKQIEELLAIPSAEAPTGIRNKAIIATLTYAGLRAMELINLKVSDVDLKEKWFHINWGKTGDRDIPISPKLEPYLIAWNSKRPRSRYFFSTLRGGKLNDRYLREFIKRYGRRIGLSWLHPHTLRHTFATRTLKRNDINTPDLQYLLGHKALASTQIYTHIEPRELYEKLRSKKENKDKKRQDLNTLFERFLELQKELALEVKEIINKALE